MGLLSRAVERIRSITTDDDVMDDDPATSADRGLAPIDQTEDRRRARLQGRVSALTLPTESAVTGLVVELTDRTGSINLVFVGRKAIPGIECGTTLRVEGLVSTRNDRRVMYNPFYEIVPRRER